MCWILLGKAETFHPPPHPHNHSDYIRMYLAINGGGGSLSMTNDSLARYVHYDCHYQWILLIHQVIVSWIQMDKNSLRLFTHFQLPLHFPLSPIRIPWPAILPLPTALLLYSMNATQTTPPSCPPSSHSPVTYCRNVLNRADTNNSETRKTFFSIMILHLIRNDKFLNKTPIKRGQREFRVNGKYLHHLKAIQ